MATPKKGLGKSFEKLFGEGKVKQSLFQKEEEEKITLDNNKNNIDVSDESLFIAPEKAKAVEEVEEEISDNAPVEISEEATKDDASTIEVEEKANTEVNEIVKDLEHQASETVESENENNSADGKPLYVPINHIHPNKDQPRKVFDEEKLNELANSIQNYGIISPIVVRRDGLKCSCSVTGTLSDAVRSAFQPLSTA